MQPLDPSDPRHAGEFRLSARLGAGGMGQVFLGYSPAGRAVAVKICHPELAADPSFVERFAREATAAQAVNGLYTAQVVGAGPYDRPPWMATAYVPGPSLSDYVDGCGPLPEPAVWRLAAGLAEALLAVHGCGLVHRDLKPSNVLLAIDGPRVIDFGIASALEASGLTTAGSVMGSPPYMSPEQAMGSPAGPASDVFALGSTLVFAACGAPPFGDGDGAALLFRVVHMEPALGSVPDRLRGVLAACLAKDPAGRPTLPQLLRACQDAVSAGGSSVASFWPARMTDVIAQHQASSANAAPVQSGGQVAAGGQDSPGGRRAPHPQTMTSSPGTPAWQPPAGGAGSAAGGFAGRRRVLAGIGGLVVAGGLAAAGWKLTSHGSTAAGTAAGHSTDQRAVWVHQAAEPVNAGPVLSSDGTTLYVGGGAGTVYELSAASGGQTGTFRVGGAVSGITVAEPTLLVAGADRMVHAFPIGNSAVSWTSPPAGAALVGAPSSGGGIVYTGSDDGYFYALDFQTGQLKWRTMVGGPAMAGPPDGTGVVSAASKDGTLYVLDTDSGKVLQQFAAGGAISSAPLYQPGSLYFGTSSGVLYNLEFDSIGDAVTIPWKFKADAAITATPVISGDTFFTATTRGTVYAVGPGLGTGTQLWSYPAGGAVQSGLAYESGVLYAGSDDRSLYAIDITTGTPRWQYKTGSAIRSGILVSNGRVYFANLGRQLYALRA
jgi:outer membrane protein assembly factor BamB